LSIGFDLLALLRRSFAVCSVEVGAASGASVGANSIPSTPGASASARIFLRVVFALQADERRIPEA
jgi:hypothetical protein